MFQQHMHGWSVAGSTAQSAPKNVAKDMPTGIADSLLTKLAFKDSFALQQKAAAFDAMSSIDMGKGIELLQKAGAFDDETTKALRHEVMAICTEIDAYLQQGTPEQFQAVFDAELAYFQNWIKAAQSKYEAAKAKITQAEYETKIAKANLDAKTAALKAQIAKDAVAAQKAAKQGGNKDSVYFTFSGQYFNGFRIGMFHKVWGVPTNPANNPPAPDKPEKYGDFPITLPPGTNGQIAKYPGLSLEIEDALQKAAGNAIYVTTGIDPTPNAARTMAAIGPWVEAYLWWYTKQQALDGFNGQNNPIRADFLEFAPDAPAVVQTQQWLSNLQADLGNAAMSAAERKAALDAATASLPADAQQTVQAYWPLAQKTAAARKDTQAWSACDAATVLADVNNGIGAATKLLSQAQAFADQLPKTLTDKEKYAVYANIGSLCEQAAPHMQELTSTALQGTLATAQQIRADAQAILASPWGQGALWYLLTCPPLAKQSLQDTIAACNRWQQTCEPALQAQAQANEAAYAALTGMLPSGWKNPWKDPFDFKKPDDVPNVQVSTGGGQTSDTGTGTVAKVGIAVALAYLASKVLR